MTRPTLRRLSELLPGALAAATVGLASAFLAQHYGGPLMLYALLFGMAFHFLSQEGRAVAGVQFTATHVLRFGVMLLGARITFADVQTLGLGPVLLVVAGVVLTILFGVFFARALGLTPRLGVLTGGSVAICGASAAMALTSVLPHKDGAERDTLVTVIGVTTLSTLAMITYPLIAAALGLDTRETGVFLGGTIHDVAQVVGAGYSVSEPTGDLATVMKLLRVAAMVPAVAVISMACPLRAYADPAEAAASRRRLPRLPWFLVGFALLAAANSAGWIPAAASSALGDASRYALVAAIAALGMKTSLQKMVEVGWRPAALIVAETLFIAGLVLGALALMR